LKKLFNPAAFSTKSIIITFSTVFLLLIIYIMGRPLLYFDNNDYRQRGLQSAVKSIGPLPDDNFDPSRVDSLITQINPPIVISVGVFATAKVPIVVRTIISSTSAHPATESWLRGPRWTDNAYLTVGADPPTLQYNWDFIILAIGSIIVAIVGLWSLYQPSKSHQMALLSGPSGGASATAPDLPEEYMIIDVQRALATSEQLFSRSTLLLVSGVVMAFVGVGVFFISVFPNEGASSSIHSLVDLLSSRQLLLAFRSFSMLVFIEAIAWFLLRQYRALIEDYKSFYRYYMRRANYLAALKISNQNRDDKQSGLIVRTFLTEDLTGRLKKDETTENLEGQRLIDKNFAETLAVSAAGVIELLVHAQRATASAHTPKKSTEPGR